MRTILKQQIDFSEIGYRRFLKYQTIPILKILELDDAFEGYSGPNYEEYAEALKLKDLYTQFLNTLTEEEGKTVAYLSYHNPNEKMPEYYYRDFPITYKKWLQIFFRKYNPTLCDISPYRLGQLMKKIRTFHKITKSALARMLNVDVSTVCLYENGKRLANLNYIKRFAYLFAITIDNLVNNSLDSTYFKRN